MIHNKVSRVGSTKRGWVVALLFINLVAVQAQDSVTFALDDNQTASVVQCPEYRSFDAESPRTPHLGAPDGCSCYEGLSGLNCGFCQDDAPCQKHDPTFTCRKGLFYEAGDTHKAFYCRLSPIWDHLYGNGQLSLYFDVASQSGTLTLYQEQTVDGRRAMDCTFEECDLKVGADVVACQSVTCSCEVQCQNFGLEVYRQMILDINNSYAEFVIGEEADSGHNITGQRMVKLRMEGKNAPLVLDAFCSASTCQPPVTQSTPDISASLPQETDSETDPSSLGEELQSSAPSWRAYAFLVGLVGSVAVFV